MGAKFAKLFSHAKHKQEVSGNAGISEQDRAILDLKNARDRLKRYQKKLDGEVALLTKQAQTLVSEGRKDRALMLLKVKRYKLHQSDKADGQMLTIAELVETVEWEGHQSQVLKALAEGNKALNALHAEMPIDEVEKLMSDTQEALDYEAQISGIIAGDWNAEAEDSLMEDFAALEKQIANEQRLSETTSEANSETAAVKTIQTAQAEATKSEAVASRTDKADATKTDGKQASISQDGAVTLDDLPAPPLDLPDVPTHAVRSAPSKANESTEDVRVAVEG